VKETDLTGDDLGTEDLKDQMMQRTLWRLIIEARQLGAWYSEVASETTEGTAGTVENQPDTWKLLAQ